VFKFSRQSEVMQYVHLKLVKIKVSEKYDQNLCFYKCNISVCAYLLHYRRPSFIITIMHFLNASVSLKFVNIGYDL
jgi:hypothetical protein